MKTNNYIEIKSCRACGSNSLKRILDLGDQPLANSFLKFRSKEDYFPLQLNLCNECFHLQLSVVVSPSLMFDNYLYLSGTTSTLKEYFKWFAKFALDDPFIKSLKKKPNVLDIACNDGSQLDQFLLNGCNTYGVDPAANLTPIAIDKGHQVFTKYWNIETSLLIQKKIDILVAQNVFAHVNDVVEFLKLCKGVLHKKGTIYIQTSQANMIKNSEFDTIYHEHLSFFNIKSMSKAVKRAGLSLVDIHKTDIHGTSYLFVLKIMEQNITEVAESKMLEEKKNGLYNLSTYQEYSSNVQSIKKDFIKICKKLRNQGVKIVGYGAAAKGNTFLNFTKYKLDYIVDDNSLKHNLLSPGLNIPVLAPSELLKENPESLCVVPLAWNFFDEIKGKVKKILKCNPKYYLRYFPIPELVE